MAGYLVGIDGGGTHLRVVVTAFDLSIISHSAGETVNPSVVGRNESAARIRAAVRRALAGADIDPRQVLGVGIGIAGASAAYASDWLWDVVEEVVPTARIAPSSDIEIALVGAHGRREGVLVLAGTGSVALAIDSHGRSARAGGWGYLLGDEGGGYWLGLQALRAVVHASDGLGMQTQLSERVLSELKLRHVQDLTLWLYSPNGPRTREVARLAPLVIDVAAAGDPAARAIIWDGAEELAALCHAVIHRVNIEVPQIAFAGGLLTTPTLLRDYLCEALGMAEPATTRYEPVIGAALLARMVCQNS